MAICRTKGERHLPPCYAGLVFMPQVCLYFQLHQPYRLGNFNVFQLDHGENYYSPDNKEIFRKVAKKSYLPMLTLLEDLLHKYPQFNFALSCSGVFLEQAKEYQSEVLDILHRLAETGRVEFLAETYYHSLAGVFSPSEFSYQVKKHHNLIKKLFGQSPKVFRNSELIYSNEIAIQVEKLRYKGILTEAVDKYLGGRDRTRIYKSYTPKPLPILLKHAPLSDDVAFRFSDRSWAEHPLTTQKYMSWVEIYPQDHIVNLFMDFETFGEHQWEDTGIFDFFADFVDNFLAKNYNKFVTPGQALSNVKLDDLEAYDVPEPISWADIDRDLTAWLGNDLQQDSISKIYEWEDDMLESKNKKLLEDWRRLQTSDHFYYMCTKWANDGDVHAYFSPYDSPFEAYRRFSIVLADLLIRLQPTK